MAHTNRQMDRRLVGNVVQVVCRAATEESDYCARKTARRLSAARLQSKGQRAKGLGRAGVGACLLLARSQWCTGGCVCVGVVERHECSRLSISESESQLCQ